MKVAVVGSRSITEYSTVKHAIQRSPWWHPSYEGQRPGVVFVSGGADGVDSLAERFAEEHGCTVEVIEPDWDDWSRGHPAKVRNTHIVEAAHAVIAVWDGNSNGTRDSIDKALDRGKNLYVETHDSR